ncbi:MAG TPA: lactonase family protein [Terriglobales bacterium]|nr:lactonase family protein [Terriglobales bacterium]
MRKLLRRFLLTLSFVLIALSAAVAADYEVFVGTYTGPKSKGIYVFHFDPETGKFMQPELAAVTENPSFLALDPKNHFLYAVNETENYKGGSSGAVSVFSLDPATAKLGFEQQVSSLGADPAYIAVDHSGKNVLVANYTSGSVAVFPIKSDGTLGEHSALDQHSGSSVDPERQKGPHAHSIQLTNDNRFAMSADLGLDKIIVHRFDAAHGTLKSNVGQPFLTVTPGSGPRHIAFDRSGKFAYVLTEMGTTVTVFSLDPKTGAMKELQTIPAVEKRDPANTGAEIAIDPSGHFLYASIRGVDVITQFAVDPNSGKLTLVERVPSVAKEPRFFTLDPTGHWMLVAGQKSDDIVLFKVDQTSGKLTPTGKKLEIGAPVCLVFVPSK